MCLSGGSFRKKKTRRNMADEGVGKIFFPRKKKKPPDKRTVTVETADKKATSDSTVRPLPTRRRCTNDQGVLAPHACDQDVRRPLATAENATDAAATTRAAAIKTMAANAPTNPQTLPGIRGIAPSVTRDLECAADEMSTAAREMNGDSDGSWLWEASPWRRPKAPPLSLPPPQPLPSRQWQPTHQLTRRHFWASGGSHPLLRHRPFTCDPAARERKGDLAGSWLWEAVGG